MSSFLAILALRANTDFRCTSRYCGRRLSLDDLEPEMGADGWSFQCPGCRQKSELVNAGIPGRISRFIQPDSDGIRATTDITFKRF